jgi:Fe-S-cluster containining protein
MSSKKSNPWYKAGLAFACQMCGRCCAGPGEGYVWAGKEEITRMAKILNLTPEEFKRKYTRRVAFRYSLIEKQPGKDCIFLRKNGQGQPVCEVYAERPVQCRTWPFWKENLRSRSAWRQAAETCPGIDQGFWYSQADIDAIRDGDLTRWNSQMTIEQAAWQWILTNRQNTQCLDAIFRVYDDLDKHLAAADPNCDNCGRCCRFADYGHRLYVTTLEILYLTQQHQLSYNDPQSLAQGRCPFQIDNDCSLRQFRTTSCRIFFCHSLDRRFQSELTEQVLARLRRLHDKFHAPYLYGDLLRWLQSAPSV